MRVGSVGSTAMYLARYQLHIEHKVCTSQGACCLAGLAAQKQGQGQAQGRGQGHQKTQYQARLRGINRRSDLFLARGWGGGRRRAINRRRAIRRSGLLFVFPYRRGDVSGNSWRWVQVEDRGIKSVIGPAIVRGTVVKRLPKFAPWMKPL